MLIDRGTCEVFGAKLGLDIERWLVQRHAGDTLKKQGSHFPATMRLRVRYLPFI